MGKKNNHQISSLSYCNLNDNEMVGKIFINKTKNDLFLCTIPIFLSLTYFIYS